MFKKTALAAAAVATAIAAAPISTANAGGIYLNIQTPHFYGGYHPQPYPHPYPKPSSMSCWQAKHSLKAQFGHVWTVECYGKYYTFKVKNWGPTRIVKFNSYNGNYWFI